MPRAMEGCCESGTTEKIEQRREGVLLSGRLQTDRKIVSR